MKLKTKLFGRTFFELETDDILEIKNKDDLSQSVIDNIAKSKTQLEYVVGETQYKQLLDIQEFFSSMDINGSIKFSADENRLKIFTKAYTAAQSATYNLISSYEHFKEKRDALKTSN